MERVQLMSPYDTHRAHTAVCAHVIIRCLMITWAQTRCVVCVQQWLGDLPGRQRQGTAMSPVPKAKAISRNIPGAPRLPEGEPALRRDPLGFWVSAFSSQEREPAAAVAQGAASEKTQVPEPIPAAQTDEPAGGEDACAQAHHRVQEALAVARTELPQNSSSPSGGSMNTGRGIARAVPAPVSKRGAPTSRLPTIHKHRCDGPAGSSSSGNVPPQPPKHSLKEAVPTGQAQPPVVPRPKSPPGRPATPQFGRGPLDPLPEPHRNFGRLIIVKVD